MAERGFVFLENEMDEVLTSDIGPTIFIEAECGNIRGTKANVLTTLKLFQRIIDHMLILLRSWVTPKDKQKYVHAISRHQGRYS